MPIIKDFLSRNSVVGVDTLPLVHTTRAFHLRSFQAENKLADSDGNDMFPEMGNMAVNAIPSGAC